LPNINEKNGPPRPQSQIRPKGIGAASIQQDAAARPLGSGVPNSNLKLLGVENFFQKWNTSGNNDAIKSELLDYVIGDNALKLDCVKRKQEFLLVLH
jgi:hypothetical protein